MVEITAMIYEQVRSKYFEEQMQKAQRRMKYWEARIDRTRPDNLMDEAHGKAADAGWEYNFYKDALEALAAQPKWISVKECLPDDHGIFLTKIHCFIGDWIEVNTFDYTEKEWWHELGNRIEKATGFVTHWLSMPLPELPKEEA